MVPSLTLKDQVGYWQGGSGRRDVHSLATALTTSAVTTESSRCRLGGRTGDHSVKDPGLERDGESSSRVGIHPTIP